MRWELIRFKINLWRAAQLWAGRSHRLSGEMSWDLRHCESHWLLTVTQNLASVSAFLPDLSRSDRDNPVLPAGSAELYPSCIVSSVFTAREADIISYYYYYYYYYYYIDKFQVELVSVFPLYTHPPPTTHNNFLIGSCDHMTSFSSNHGSKFAATALLLSHWLVFALCTNSRGAVAYAFKVCENSVSS